MERIHDIWNGITGWFTGFGSRFQELHFSLPKLKLDEDLVQVLLLWAVLFLLLLELISMLKSLPAVAFSPVYLNIRRAGVSEQQEASRNYALRKVSTRVGSNMFMKDVTLLRSTRAFSFDIVYKDNSYWIYEKGNAPFEIELDVAFRRGDYFFTLIKKNYKGGLL